MLVDPLTVWRAIQCFKSTVQLTHVATYTALDEFLTLEAVINHPGIHFCEIQCLVEQTTGTTISESAIVTLILHKNTFLCKKLQRVVRHKGEGAVQL